MHDFQKKIQALDVTAIKSQKHSWSHFLWN